MPEVEEQEEKPNADTLDPSTLSEEALDRLMAERQAAGDGEGEETQEADPAGDQTGDPGAKEGASAKEETPERGEGGAEGGEKLYFGKYKSIEEAERGWQERESLLARQGNELGQLRANVQAGYKEKPEAPEEITDEAIHAAFYEEMNPQKGYALLRERERRAEAVAREEERAQETYGHSLKEGFEALCRDIPGYGNPEKFGTPEALGETGKQIIQYAQGQGYTDQDFARIALDPAGGARLIRSLHREMQLKGEIDGLHQKVAEIGKNINRAAARGPKILDGGGGAPKGEAEIPNLTQAQIMALSDAELAEYEKRVAARSK